MPRRIRWPGSRGFTLLPVVLAMSLVAAIAFLLNRDNGVNANLIGAQSDRERARYAAEAGLQAANYAIQAKVCAGGYPISSSPVTDSNFGGATYSAYASSISGLRPSLTSIGTYKGASVTLTKSTVYTFQSGIQTWTTQPGFPLSKDTFVDPSSPDVPHGFIYNEITLTYHGAELLIQFDLSPLPTGSKIVPWFGAGKLQPGANLMLHRHNATTSPGSIVDVMLITRSWSELFATWNNYTLLSPWPSPGIGYDLRTVSTNPYSTDALGWQSLDLTNAAIAWMNGLYPNSGVWIRGGPGVSNAKIWLSEAAAADRPKLVVSYLLPCGATAPP